MLGFCFFLCVAPLDCLGFLQGNCWQNNKPAPRKTYIAPNTFFIGENKRGLAWCCMRWAAFAPSLYQRRQIRHDIRHLGSSIFPPFCPHLNPCFFSLGTSPVIWLSFWWTCITSAFLTLETAEPHSDAWNHDADLASIQWEQHFPTQITVDWQNAKHLQQFPMALTISGRS